MEQQKARRLFIRTPGPLDRAQDRELWWVPRKELSLATSCDFRLGKDDTNLERSETSGLSRGHVDACLGPSLARALASRVSISYLLRVSPDLVGALEGVLVYAGGLTPFFTFALRRRRILRSARV